MDFKEQIKQLGDRVLRFKDQTLTEEATKSAFIMPFIQILGYDLFNPLEVVPEFVTDYGVKNAEKVDYAIFKDQQPVLIIECKYHQENLEKHYTQIHKYFHLTKARFAVLTNGIQYNFYTDLDNANKMDEKPFLSFDITNIKDQQIKELAKFHKSGFDVTQILTTASELKYSNAIKTVLANELINPSPEFVKFFVSRVHEGRATEKVILQFTELVKKTVDQTFQDIVSDRLMKAINQAKQQTEEVKQEEPSVNQEEENKIVTTVEELNGYYIVKSILRTKIEASRIFNRDSINYLSIILDDNNKKPICRLWLNSQKKKYLGTFDFEKKETKHEISSLDDIYNFSTELLAMVDFYENK
ncbi:MAG TPA: type I restriction enzyme HsdR N-terminal domain-containing protein, partial [Prolixibacteraceae bacterium]|nr:type I restriction enzyme HsdR N-terminal domain-containing protein [Prolixibacteraceae bacterium]